MGSSAPHLLSILGHLEHQVFLLCPSFFFCFVSPVIDISLDRTSKFCVVREVKNLNKRESRHCAVQFLKHTGQYQSMSL
jgi:hypothetical protein